MFGKTSFILSFVPVVTIPLSYFGLAHVDKHSFLTDVFTVLIMLSPLIWITAIILAIISFKKEKQRAFAFGGLITGIKLLLIFVGIVLLLVLYS